MSRRERNPSPERERAWPSRSRVTDEAESGRGREIGRAVLTQVLLVSGTNAEPAASQANPTTPPREPGCRVSQRWDRALLATPRLSPGGVTVEADQCRGVLAAQMVLVSSDVDSCLLVWRARGPGSVWVQGR